jgi:cytochrome c-type biogenesis protein CcmH/NrfG
MSWATVVGAFAMAAVAALGVLFPFSRWRGPAVHNVIDPLDEERATLLRSLDELTGDLAVGTVGEEEYHRARRETERRAVLVLKALESGGGRGALAAGLNDLRVSRRDGHRGTAPARIRRPAGMGVGLVVASTTFALLFGAVRSRAPDGIGVANSSAPAGPVDLAFFEERVQQHPSDVAARLDLAQRYLDAGDLGKASAQYLVALKLDPNNAEANTKIGYLLFLSGAPRDGLRAVEAALRTDPRYAEALFVKGLVLLKGLNRPGTAADALRAYLEAAPFGAARAEAEKLLQEAHGEMAR